MNEHQHQEWKEVWRDEHLKWISAFANAEGGVLTIGRNDAGQIVGLTQARKLLEDLPNKIRDVLGLIVPVNLHEADGKAWLEIVVAAAPYPVSYKGAYFVRSGSTQQELKGAALDQFLLRKQGRHWDGVPVPGLTGADLDAASLARFRQQAARSGRLSAQSLQASDAALLDKLKLTDGAYLKRAALLLFHPEPTRFVSGAFVKLGFFRSQSDLVYHDEVTGDLFTQAQQTLDLLQTKYLKAAIHYEGLQRIERFPVPAAALREALVNALVHRDYAVPAPVQIRVYDDRLSLWNPALLPPAWTADKLLGEHASVPFNPDIANTFFRAGDIEAWGRGIHRMLQACREAGTPEPVLRCDTGELALEFAFSAEYLALIGGPSRVPLQVPPEVTPEVTPAVTPEVGRLLVVLKGEMNRVELMAALGLRDEKHFRQHYQQAAVAAGLIEMTLPDKPNSRLQRYRLTPAGRAMQQALNTRHGGP